MGTAFSGQGGRYHQTIIFPAQEVRDAVTPHGHNGTGIKLQRLPGIAASHATCRGGEVNVGMPLLVAAPGMDNGKTAGQKTAATSGFEGNVSGETVHLREQPAVVVYQRPELTGEREGDVLPFAVRDEGQQILYPYFTGLHAAVRAGAGFTAEADFFE